MIAPVDREAVPARHAPGAPSKAARDACLEDPGRPQPGALALALEATTASRWRRWRPGRSRRARSAGSARNRALSATLPGTVRERLAGRLESPAGLPLRGRGAAAIAPPLVARLQAQAQRLDEEQGRRDARVPESRSLQTPEAPPC